MDEGGRDRKAPRRNAGRGVAYWTDGQEERIFVVTTGLGLRPRNELLLHPVEDRSRNHHGCQGSVKGLPIQKPPYSRITALDLNKGEFAWMVPLGTTPERVSQNPALNGIKLPNTGGIICMPRFSSRRRC
jgi:hypothetical protein